MSKFYHRVRRDTHPAARDVAFQGALLAAFEQITGAQILERETRTRTS